MESLNKLRDLRKAVYKLSITGPITDKTLAKVEGALLRRRWHLPAALALVVNSPGGSAAQSSILAQTLKTYCTTKGIPFYAFAEDIAASGGYYVMTGADCLYATNASLVGSIGCRFSFIGLKDLAQHYGIERRHWSTSPLAFEERLDPLRDFSPEARTWATSLVNQTAEEFAEAVKASRQGKLDLDKAEELFGGDVFPAEKARELGLIDEIGTHREVLKAKFPKLTVKELIKQSPWSRH